MNRALLASHLGFPTWRALVEASERVTSRDGDAWYVTQTPTWYKWVVWNTNGDVWFHYRSRTSALEAFRPLRVAKTFRAIVNTKCFGVQTDTITSKI